MKFYISTRQERIPSYEVIYMRRTGEYGAENYKLMDTFKKWLKENNLYDEDTAIQVKCRELEGGELCIPILP